MNVNEMRQLPAEELLSEIEKTREKVFRMRFQGSGKDKEKPGHRTLLKKDIARMYTVLSERKARAKSERPSASPAPSAPAAEGSGQPGEAH